MSNFFSFVFQNRDKRRKSADVELDYVSANDLGKSVKDRRLLSGMLCPNFFLNEEELDFIEYYLADRDQIRGSSYILLSCATVIDRLVRYDSTRYVICRGVKLVVHLLHCLKEWAAELPQGAPATHERICCYD